MRLGHPGCPIPTRRSGVGVSGPIRTLRRRQRDLVTTLLTPNARHHSATLAGALRKKLY